jgi:hypothetical protein
LSERLTVTQKSPAGGILQAIFLCDGMARIIFHQDAAVISRSPATARIVPSDAWSVLYEDISETTRMRGICCAKEH